MIRAESRNIGGSALARAAISGSLEEWYSAQPIGVSGWIDASSQVAKEFEGRAWLAELEPALRASAAAAERLRAASEPGGIVVTGGQQPGLFGGPLYVLHKALTQLEMADALASITGRAVAPIFWAATDDTDLAEANHVSVVHRGAVERLTMLPDAQPGRAMSRTPLGDVSAQTALLEEACGSAPVQSVLDSVRRSYSGGTSVGDAYVSLLRAVLEPLGIAVLDASHPAVRKVGRDTMVRALMRSEEIGIGLRARTSSIRDADFHPQVADVPNLSLVFETLDDGTRRRVPIREAREVAERAQAEQLGPNVLLRPIMERQILPTVTYVGGAGEVAYFAQVSAVADALGMAAPRITPRWSGTLMEPHIDDMLARLGATVDEFADPHAVESRVARDAVSPRVQSAIASLRTALDSSAESMRDDAQTNEALSKSVGTMRAGVEHRLARLERRYAAAIKQRGSERLREVSMVRATLFPEGVAQERMLSFIPYLARYGTAVVDAIRGQARSHVASMMQGG